METLTNVLVLSSGYFNLNAPISGSVSLATVMDHLIDTYNTHMVLLNLTDKFREMVVDFKRMETATEHVFVNHVYWEKITKRVLKGFTLSEMKRAIDK